MRPPEDSPGTDAGTSPGAGRVAHDRLRPAHAQLPADAGDWLLPEARAAIDEAVSARPGVRRRPAAPDWAELPGACFVTLTVRGDRRPEKLRGCIGSLLPWRSLAADVRGNAVAAATRDPRFPAVGPTEPAGLRIEVSVLSDSLPIDFTSEAQLRTLLRPGIDGLVLEWDGHRGTFLPQVWQQLPDPGTFLDQLKRKAGLPVTWWSDDAVVERYTVTAWQEEP